MSERLSVLVTLPKEKMEAINKRADELGVTTGHLAGCLLDNGVGTEVLPRVYLEEPKLCIEEE